MELTNLSREEKKAYDLEQIDALVQKNQGMAKTADILAMGIDYRRILQFLKEGYLKRVKSGYYTTKYFDGSEESMVARMFSDGVLTMESALLSRLSGTASLCMAHCCQQECFQVPL